jgi:hypothetical protein
MSRTTLVLAACAAIAVLAQACGAADSLLQTNPVEAGAAEATTDASTPDQGGTDTTVTPPPEASPEVSKPPVEAAPDVPVIYDGPTPDTGTHATKGCLAQGGVLCTEARWELCPAGFEPVAGADGHLNCGMSHDGWCCQAAPVTSCSMSGQANCVVNACTGCFAPSPDKSLACEPGRACCVDMCN